MTGSLFLLGLALLLVAVLNRTHRRTVHHWRPGLDTRRDRDVARTEDDLRFAGQADPEQAASPIVHLAAPHAAATDARVLTRTAA